MTPTPSETPAQPGELAQAEDPGKKPAGTRSVQPVLEKLFELYPQLFGARFLPLKLGIFQELLAAHPDHFERDTLKAALGLHTRSTRYLQSVAAGHKRHDLQGLPIESVAPEHVYFAVVELFRRRQGRSSEDLRPKLRLQLMAAFEASGLTRQEYLCRIQTNDVQANTLLEEAFDERDQKLARREALLRAFTSSGMTPDAFADTYGVPQRDLITALHQSHVAQPLQSAGKT